MVKVDIHFEPINGQYLVTDKHDMELPALPRIGDTIIEQPDDEILDEIPDVPGHIKMLEIPGYIVGVWTVKIVAFSLPISDGSEGRIDIFCEARPDHDKSPLPEWITKPRFN